MRLLCHDHVYYPLYQKVKRVNVYDFDKTIYRGDSTVDFYLFALKSNPAILCFVPVQLSGAIKYALKLIDKTQFKAAFFSFLRAVDAETLVNKFWKSTQGKIYPWYLNQRQASDVIISASPEFLLRPVCDKLGIKYLIASNVDISTGKFIGRNCRGEEKARRFAAEYGSAHIDNFYSDSLSDTPLARLAENAFILDEGQISPWPFS